MTDPKSGPADKAESETTKIDTSKLVKPNEDSSNEPTPIADEAQKAAAAKEQPPAEEPQAPETADHFDKKDVAAALKRETQDGKGDEDPGPSDWNGYATEGVEKEESQ